MSEPSINMKNQKINQVEGSHAFNNDQYCKCYGYDRIQQAIITAFHLAINTHAGSSVEQDNAIWRLRGMLHYPGVADSTGNISIMTWRRR